MTKKLTFFLILMIGLLFSCEKKQSDLEFEQSVVYEIFPALMDSLHFDLRLTPPPPPRPIFNEKGEIIGTDTTGIAKALTEYQKRKAELKADSVKLVIAINDSVYSLDKRERNQLLKHFAEYNLKLDSTDLSAKYKIDLNKLQADKKLRFKYLSEFPKGSAIWKKKGVLPDIESQETGPETEIESQAFHERSRAPSTSAAESANGWATAWNEPIRRPNCLRSQA